MELFDVYIAAYSGRLMNYSNQVAYVQKYSPHHGVMSFYETHDNGDEFMILDLLFCEEANMIYIMDYYGFNFHSWEDQLEYMPHNAVSGGNLVENLQECKEILKKMYGLNTRLYNKGNFKALCNEHIDDARWKSQALGSRLPYDLTQYIYDKIVPAWTSCSQKFWKGRWAPYKAVHDSYEEAIELFNSVVPNLRDERTRAFYQPTGKDTFLTLSKIVVV